MKLLINQKPKTNIRQAIKKPEVTCPRCKQSHCERTSRGKIVKVLFFWLAIKRYKCYGCSHKFYVINSRKKQFADLLSQ